MSFIFLSEERPWIYCYVIVVFSISSKAFFNISIVTDREIAKPNNFGFAVSLGYALFAVD